MGEFIDDTPISVILEQATKYTARQLNLLHGDLDQLPNKPKDGEILKLYERAYKLDDSNALDCIVNRFPINQIMKGWNDGLPDTTEEETEQSFDELYEMMQSINPFSRIQSKADSEYRNRRSYRKFYNIPEKARILGAMHYRSCFHLENGRYRFYVRVFLCLIPSEHVIKLMKRFPDYTRGLSGLVTSRQIDWLCGHEDFHQKLLVYLRENNFVHPFPLEDILELENGTIEMTDDKIKYY